MNNKNEHWYTVNGKALTNNGYDYERVSFLSEHGVVLQTQIYMGDDSSCVAVIPHVCGSGLHVVIFVPQQYNPVIKW